MSGTNRTLLSWKSFYRAAGVSMVMVLIALLLAFGALIRDSDRSARQALADRFETRAALTVSFTQKFVGDLAARERKQAERLLAAPVVDRAAFEAVVLAFDFKAAVLLDDNGRLLQVWPRRPELLGRDMTKDYAHLRAAVQGQVGVSGVVPSAANGLPIAAVAVPFQSAGGQRVFSGASAPSDSPLGDYLAAVVPITGGSAHVEDEAGTVLAGGDSPGAGGLALRNLPLGATSLSLDAGRVTAVVAQVPQLPWRVVISAPDERLYAPLAGRAFAPWALWVMLAAWGCLAIGLFVRLGRARSYAEATARTDALTDLPNRRGMEDALETAAALSKRHQIPLAALMIDIDRFKRINDAHGHDAGDAVIREIANALRAGTRDGDVAGRWGGEEFLVILPYSDHVAAAIVAERIRGLISSSILTNGIVGTSVTVSIGVGELREGDAAQMLRDADEALYDAKSNGRNRVALSSERGMASV